MSPKQLEATRMLTDPKVSALLYGGAIRGAKTAWGALTMFQLAASFPNSRGCMMRADTPKITTNLLPSVSNFYSKPEIKRYIKSFNKNTLEFTLKNRSVIKMFPESFNQDKTLSRFLGLEMNWFFLDELSEYQQVTWDNAFVRAGSWLNAEPNKWGHYPRALVMASCNPSKTWVKDKWYDPWINNGRVHPNPKWRYVPAKITDNPWVKQSYLDGLKETMTPMNYRRFVDGDWEYVERSGNEWLNKFDYTQHVKPVAYDKTRPTFLTFDFNVVPYSTMLCFQVRQENGVTYISFYDEFCLANVRECVRAWILEYPTKFGPAPVSYCGDRSGENRVAGFGDIRAFHEVQKELKRYTHQGSDRIFRKQFFNEFARTLLNDALTGIMNSGMRVVVEIDQTRCPNLIRDIQDTLENKDGGFTKEKAVYPETGIAYEKNGHCVDAMKYGFLSVFSEEYLTQYHSKPY